jgi:tetratricopeptide (TPR) repeat protein
MGAMSDAAFLSYADEDAVVALRIHQALTRSGMPVWGYKENGRIGVDFREEFRERIRGSRYFCLLDSQYSRLSQWIKQEWNLAVEAKAIKVICRVETRIEGKEWRRVELFKGQNLLAAIDFKVFEIGIHRLCEHLGIAYTPAFRLPRDQDFSKEVFEAGLNDRDRVEELHDLYHEFREQFADVEFAEAQLRIIIRKCQRYGATNVVSPILALGVLLGEAGRHREALKIFQSLTESHPRDPRGWAGAGGAYFQLGMYERSLTALKRADETIREFYPRESADRLPEVLHNIGSLLLLLDRTKEAWAVLNRFSVDQRKLPYVQALEGRLLLAGDKAAAALPHLEAAYHEFRQQYSAPPSLVMSLADCYRDLGQSAKEIELMKATLDMVPSQPELCHRAADCFLRHAKVQDAAAAMRKATESLPESPLYRSQFAALLHQSGKVDEGLTHARECVRSGLTAQERYYRGLAYYLLGQTESAEFDLAESRKDAVIAEWPHYKEVLRMPGRQGIQLGRGHGWRWAARTVFLKRGAQV